MRTNRTFGAFVALLYAGQRKLQYFPDSERTPPAQAGLPEAEELFLRTADGQITLRTAAGPVSIASR